MSLPFARSGLMLRILCALLVPSLGLIAAATVIVLDKASTVREMQNLTMLTGLATTISGLVHEMQKERGASAVFLGSNGQQLKREVPEQRLLTDDQRKRLDATVMEFNAGSGSRLATILNEAMTQVGRLDTIRRDIGELKISAAESNAYFTTTIARLLDAGLEISQLVTNASVARALSAYTSFMEAKERSGQERATGAPGFAAGKFNLVQYRLFAGVVASQSTYFSLFNSYATKEDQAFLASTVSGPPVAEVERMRKLALEAMPGQQLPGADGAQWFQATTARINLMKKVEDHLAENLLALAERTGAAAKSAFWTAVGATLAMIALTVILGYFIVRGITRPIKALTRAMLELANGRFDVVLPGLGRRDEIGDIAGSVETFKVKAQERAQLEAEKQAAQEREAAAQRKADTRRVADNFESAVG